MNNENLSPEQANTKHGLLAIKKYSPHLEFVCLLSFENRGFLRNAETC